MLVAIDGPAGAGKSTVARALARELGFTYLDSGAMYRCVALAALAHGAGALPDARSPGELAARPDRARARPRERPAAVLLDGRDVTEAIRAPEVSEAASRVAADPGVREALVAKQRELIARGDWVAEGRDIGTVVAPDAALKIFLTAEPARARAPARGRARRRCRDGARRAGAARRARHARASTARCGRARTRSRSTRPA